jgi:hypothetical protein
MTDTTSISNNPIKDNDPSSVIKIKNGKYKTLVEICTEWNKNKLYNKKSKNFLKQ